MKKFNTLAVLTLSLTLSQGLLASEQCAKELQTKVDKITKICKKDAGSEVCKLNLTNNCQDILDSVNSKLASLNKSIHDHLMSSNLDSASTVKQIKHDINTSFKVAAILSTPVQAREQKAQQEKILNQFQRMLKKDSQFLTRVHPNGMTSREIYQKFNESNYQMGVAQAFKIALERTKTDKTKTFDQHFVEAFTSDNELNSIYAARPLNNNSRVIANGDGFGLHIYSCLKDFSSLNKSYDSTPTPNSDFHILLFGMSKCQNYPSTINEYTVGPGLYWSGVRFEALVCLSYGEKFYGVGVTAKAGALAGIGIGTYIGSLGACLKVEVTALSFGAKAGLSYISATNPTFSAATNKVERYYKEEILELK